LPKQAVFLCASSTDICKIEKNAARQKLIVEILLALLESKKTSIKFSLHIDSEAKKYLRKGDYKIF